MNLNRLTVIAVITILTILLLVSATSYARANINDELKLYDDYQTDKACITLISTMSTYYSITYAYSKSYHIPRERELVLELIPFAWHDLAYRLLDYSDTLTIDIRKFGAMTRYLINDEMLKQETYIQCRTYFGYPVEY